MATFKVRLRKGTGKNKRIFVERVSGFDSGKDIKTQFRKGKKKFKTLKGVVIVSASKIRAKIKRKKMTPKRGTRKGSGRRKGKGKKRK